MEAQEIHNLEGNLTQQISVLSLIVHPQLIPGFLSYFSVAYFLSFSISSEALLVLHEVRKIESCLIYKVRNAQDFPKVLFDQKRILDRGNQAVLYIN